MHRGVEAEIDLSAIANNLKAITAITGNKQVIAVVKADAYGHGSAEVAARLVKAGAAYLSVAFCDEAKELRHYGIKAPIIVLFDPDPKDIFDYNLIPVIGDKKSAEALSREAVKRHKKLIVHIKVDTGMGRIGFIENTTENLIEIAQMEGLIVDGLMSHFSDSDAQDLSFAKTQISKFNDLRKALIKNGLNIKTFHMANSAAILSLPESHFNAVRPGLLLYGSSPFDSSASNFPSAYPRFEQAMSIKARLVALRNVPAGFPVSYGRTFVTKRDSFIGVVSIGYADGYSRLFSNNAEVLVRGRRIPVAGRVCMDLTMVDLTDIKDEVTEKDEVVVIGRQDKEFISANELAFKANTISYEILTSLGRGSKKRYKN